MMFKQLIEALNARNLKQRESVSLKNLCRESGLCITLWQERFNSSSVSFMVREDLEAAGYEVRGYITGNRRQWVIAKL